MTDNDGGFHRTQELTPGSRERQKLYEHFLQTSLGFHLPVSCLEVTLFDKIVMQTPDLQGFCPKCIYAHEPGIVREDGSPVVTTRQLSSLKGASIRVYAFRCHLRAYQLYR